MLAVSQLGKKVPTQEGDLEILHDIRFQIQTGESVAITGASGSGKTTLLGLLAGLDLPTSGEVILAGQALHALDEDQRAAVRGRYTGFVFQSFQLLEELTALENVMLPLELLQQNMRPSQIRQQAQSWLDQVGLGHRLAHYPNQLSGGEQQRVAIARAFVNAPKIVFADEPTGNLDQATGEKIINLLFELNQTQGTTLVLVTHDEQLASRCQRRMHLEQGCLQA